MSVMEIYNENIRDLTAPKEVSLDIRVDGAGNVKVDGLSEVPVTGVADVSAHTCGACDPTPWR